MHWCAHHTISIAMILKRPNKWYVPTASPHGLFMHMVICENNSCPNNYCHITNLYWYLYSISIYLECVLHVPLLCLSNRQYQWLTPIFWVSYDRCEHPDLGACELIAQRSVEPEQSSTGNPPTLSDTRFCAISLRVTCFACVTCFRKLFQGPGRHEAAGSCRRSPLLPRAACTTKHTVSLLLLRGSKRAFAGTGMYCMCCSAPTHPLCIAHTTRDIADAYAQ